jgi:lipopolysaccharide biosynthesis glycosyltransferase
MVKVTENHEVEEGSRSMDIGSSPSKPPLSASESTGQALNIVTISSEHYAQHLSVMLLSLFENNRNHIVNAFVIVPDVMQESLFDKIRTSVKEFSNNVHFCKIDPSVVDNLQIFGHLTVAAYYRLLMGDALPQNVHRVIYLDPDIIVRGDLEELWNFSIGNSVVGAVPDIIAKPQKKLGLHPDAPYFNSGVLLVDLDRWREARAGLDALDFARSHGDRMTFTEQCAQNWVLRGRWTPLPECWNLQTHMAARLRWGFMDYTGDAKKRAKAAKIVHFTGSLKPWHYMNNHPLKREYLAYLSRTEWKNYNYPDYSLRNFIRKNLYRFAPFMLRIHYMMRERLPIWRRRGEIGNKSRTRAHGERVYPK